MAILRPDTKGNGELLHVNVHEASVLEPLLQLGPRTSFVTGLLKCTIDLTEILLEPGVFETAVLRVGVAVPVLKLNPASGLD